VKITAGINHDLYRASTDGNPEAHLPVDPVAADRLGAWFGFANSVLEDVRFHSSPESEPGRVQLWPEHFDLGVDIGAPGAKGTFGASPGDEPHPEPYLYVTRWQDGPDGPFWNDTAFDGASLAYANLVAAPDARAAALTFFRTGFDQL
jgi:hypothetical protein